jgi:threonine dehydratase
VAVSEAEIAAATLLVLEQAHLLVEPSGAPGFAAAFAYQGYLPANVPIVCIASGGNVTLETVFRLQKQQSSANL